MKKKKYVVYLYAFVLCLGCKGKKEEVAKFQVSEDFPSEMVSFKPNPKAPVFMGVNAENAWDKNLRERGYILFEDDITIVLALKDF